jgi:hypothetical protein
MRANRLLLAALLTSLVGPPAAEACSCDQNPPCAAAWKADAVFIGTIVERTQEPLGGTLSWTVHHVAVNQRLLGAIGPFVTLLPAATRPTAERIEASKAHDDALYLESSCDYTFETGRQYVIYARRTDDGRWTTSECSGTKPIERAAADLDTGRSKRWCSSTSRRTASRSGSPGNIQSIFPVPQFPSSSVPQFLSSSVPVDCRP